VGILCCFYGIKTLTAISIIAEVFDFGRFASARDLMSYLGLTPSESSSGEKEHKGPITKTGNKRVRRLLTEVSLNGLLTSQTEQGYDYTGVIAGLLIRVSCLAKL